MMTTYTSQELAVEAQQQAIREQQQTGQPVRLLAWRIVIRGADGAGTTQLAVDLRVAGHAQTRMVAI